MRGWGLTDLHDGEEIFSVFQRPVHPLSLHVRENSVGEEIPTRQHVSLDNDNMIRSLHYSSHLQLLRSS